MIKKVLIVDDSALMRRVISDIIEADKRLMVEDTANNGRKALDLILSGKRYDIILTDIRMPKMDGVQLLREMNTRKIRIPTLMVSSIASESAKETIEALELGAIDFVRKPEGAAVGGAFAAFSDKLLRQIHCVLDARKIPQRTVTPPKRATVTPPVRPAGRGSKYFGLVVIVSSTGGPRSLQEVIPRLPAGFPYPVVLIQHMPAGFTVSLAARLDEMSQVQVKEADDGEVLRAGCVYIARGGQQCELVRNASGQFCISVNDKPPRGGLKPCADIFFESLVDSPYTEIYCVVLTGMGSDGSKGIQLIKESKHVRVVAQNEETCVVYGMPKAAKMAGVVDEMVPLEQVTSALIKQIGE